MVISSLLLCGFCNYWLFIWAGPLFVLFIYIRRYYQHSAEDFKRLEQTVYNPVCTHISDTLPGLPSVHAFCAEDSLQATFDRHNDKYISLQYTDLACLRWFALRMELLAFLLVCATSFGAIPAAEGLPFM